MSVLAERRLGARPGDGSVQRKEETMRTPSGNHASTGGRWRLLLALVALAALAALTLPAAAMAAGHIQSRFGGDMSPDPNPGWTGIYYPQIGGDAVSYQIFDINGEDWGYQWTIGQPVAVELPQLDTSDRDASGPLTAYIEGHATIAVWDGVTSHVVYSAPAFKVAHVSISGNVVVWADQTSGNWDIRGAHLDPVTHDVVDTFPICTQTSKQINPDVGGDWVVWQDHRHGQFDIYGRDLVTHQTRAICLNTQPQDSPATDGKHVVWVDWRSHVTGGDIYGYSIATKATRVVCGKPKAQKQPDIGDGFVVWTDYTKVNPDAEVPNNDVYGYDWASGDTFVLQAGSGQQSEPDIDGNTVVWVDRTWGDQGQPWGIDLEGAVLKH